MKITNPDNLGAGLRTLRGTLTLREVAKKSGLDHTYLSKIESSREIPSWEAIKKLLRVYGGPSDLRPWAYWQLVSTHKEQLKLAIAFANEHNIQ